MTATRRSFLSMAAVPVALGSAAGLRIAVAAEPHPDAALFAAERTYQEARAAWVMASEAKRAAGDAFDAALGICPPELERVMN